MASRQSPIGRALAIWAVVISCAACQSPDSGNLFELSRVDAAWNNGRVTVDYRQRLQLSPEARNALVHGVPLTVEIEVILRDTSSQNRVGSDTRFYEIRYLPLSDHYQLTGGDGFQVKTFPRLRHVLADLRDLDLDLETGVLPGGEYELLARIRLDRREMPPPMQLPALLSPEWRHDSNWSAWPLTIDPGA